MKCRFDTIDNRMQPTITAIRPYLDVELHALLSKKHYFVRPRRSMKTKTLKRISLHIGFWLVYMAQDVTLIYLWNKGIISQFSSSRQLTIAIENSIFSLIPKMLFSYYAIYHNLPRLLNRKAQRPKYIALLLLAMIASTFIYRLVANYVISPLVYKGSISFAKFFNAVWYFNALMDIGFASGAAIMIKQTRLQFAAKDKENHLIRDKLETELKFLRNQTNPHFLFNTLNNIYALARKKSDETADVVMKLSKLLRFMLYETKNEQIKISDEIKILDDYIELEKLRYNDRLTISFLRDIDNENEQIAPLLLIPFVENAFKHGASESRFESYINLEMNLQNGILEFAVENTKEQQGTKLNDENIGLTNVRRQLELLYPEHEVSIKCEETLFKVFVKINLRKYANVQLHNY
jgi:two-component system, LytTR family, sensor kinase